MTLFMKLSDIALFARSAKSDARIRDWWRDGSAATVFDRLYQGAPDNDPWASASPCFRYQHRKYDTVASLIPLSGYGRALDIGCGTGVFSERLTAFASNVVGVDVSDVAVTVARSRTKQMPNLDFMQADVLDLPSSWDGSFDLITILDTLYYLPPPIDDDLLKALASRLSRLMSPRGVLLLANHFFSGLDADSRLTKRIHDAFRWSPALEAFELHRRPFYLVSLLRTAGNGTLSRPFAMVDE
jgi:SAM-dependent methyltransferase